MPDYLLQDLLLTVCFVFFSCIIISCWCSFSFLMVFALMVIVRLLSYVHDSVMHGKIVLCAIGCFMEIKVWPIKHSVRLCSIKHSSSL